MQRYVADANIGRRPNDQYDMGIFNQFVLMQRHDATEAAAQKLIDQMIPRRMVRRRHSMMNLAEIVDEERDEMPHVAPLPTQVPAKRRRASMDARTYLAPPEVRPAIDTLRQIDGVLNYRSSFHSVKRKQANVAAIGSFADVNTNINTSTNEETNSFSNMPSSEHNVDIIMENADTGDAIMDNISDSGTICPENVADGEAEPMIVDMENIGANNDSTASLGKETLEQMEENLRRLRESLGKFYDSVFVFRYLVIKIVNPKEAINRCEIYFTAIFFY